MAKLSKRRRLIQEKVDLQKAYPIEEAVEAFKSLPPAKFSESFELAVSLGVNARKSDQVVRHATQLPHGTGKKVRVAVFAQGEKAEAASAAGADVVGMQDLVEQMQGGDLAFDVVIASPDAMVVVGRLGALLGPRGLMPNPKVGTVSADVATAVKNAKAGQVRYRTDKAGIIHCLVGKIDFAAHSLKENIEAVLIDLKKVKPATAKGVYIKKISLATTMGPGLTLEQGSLVF